MDFLVPFLVFKPSGIIGTGEAFDGEVSGHPRVCIIPFAFSRRTTNHLSAQYRLRKKPP